MCSSHEIPKLNISMYMLIRCDSNIPVFVAFGGFWRGFRMSPHRQLERLFDWYRYLCCRTWCRDYTLLVSWTKIWHGCVFNCLMWLEPRYEIRPIDQQANSKKWWRIMKRNGQNQRTVEQVRTVSTRGSMISTTREAKVSCDAFYFRSDLQVPGGRWQNRWNKQATRVSGEWLNYHERLRFRPKPPWICLWNFNEY